jgi:hypothetical protein
MFVGGMTIVPYLCVRPPTGASEGQRKEDTILWILESAILSKRYAKWMPVTGRLCK